MIRQMIENIVSEVIAAFGIGAGLVSGLVVIIRLIKFALFIG